MHQTAWLLQRCGSASSRPEGIPIGSIFFFEIPFKPNAKTHGPIPKNIYGCDFNHPHNARFRAARGFPTEADSVPSKCSYFIRRCVQSLTDWMLRALKAMRSRRSKHHQGHRHTHTQTHTLADTTVTSNSCPPFRSPLSCCCFYHTSIPV